MVRLDSITNSVDTHLSKLREILENRGAWCVQSMGSQRVGHDLATEQHLLSYSSEGHTFNTALSVLKSGACWAVFLGVQGKIHFPAFFHFQRIPTLFDPWIFSSIIKVSFFHAAISLVLPLPPLLSFARALVGIIGSSRSSRTILLSYNFNYLLLT